MLNSEVIDLMTGRLGRREATLIRQICGLELNQAIRELERAPTKPWFLEATEEDSTVAEQGYIDLPSDFLMEIEEGTFEVLNSEGKWQELTKVSRERLREVTANTDSAFPEGYAIWGDRFLLGPTPDAAYSYRFDYYARTSTFVENSNPVDNKWLLEFFDYVTYKALTTVARDHIRNDQIATNVANAFRIAEDRFTREVTAREMANQTLLLTNEEN